jgi:CRP-like cAMP-binding protein
VSASTAIKAGTHLIREKERADCLFIVCTGWAFRYSITREGGRQISALLLPGDIANLDSLMFDRLDYGVCAVSEATIVALSRDRALALAAEHPGIAQSFTRLASIENSALTKWVLSLGRRPAKQRLAHLLCEISLRLDAEQDNESRFYYPLVQEQLADTLGLTPVHVNRTMQQLRTERLIVTGSKMMVLPDMARLRETGGFDPHYLHLN